MKLLKTQLSAMELKYIMEDLQILEDAKMDQIYQIEKKDFIFQFHKTGIGKIRIRISTPNFTYLTEHKPEVLSPKGFCMGLRKHLKNARLRTISQPGFERIISMQFETRDNKYHIYIELFNKGNIILADSKDMIINVAEHQRWTERIIKPNHPYSYPKKEYDFPTFTKQQFKNMISSADKEIVKVIAADLGLGGQYAEDILAEAGIDKSSKKLTDSQITILNTCIKDLRQKKAEPMIIYENKNTIKDIIPFQLSAYEKKEKKLYNSYSKAFDDILWQIYEEERKAESTSTYDTKLLKRKKMIDIQESSLKNLKKTEKDSTVAGDLIYSNYQIIKNILQELKKARETMSWKDIKEKLKGHKVIKDIKEKEGKIVVEI